MAITIDRLSGGNTPADGSDPRTFPAIWNATAAILEANVGEGGGGSITVSPTPPTDPAPENGNLWWNSTEGEMYIYYVDGSSSQWVAAAGPSVTVAATAPTGYEGQLWLDSTDGSMYVYYTDPGGANAQWIGAVSRSGGILQVVSTTKTDTFSTTSTSYADVTGLSATITPRSTSSKVYAIVSAVIGFNHPTSDRGLLSIFRGATNLSNPTSPGSRTPALAGFDSSIVSNGVENISVSFLDAPSTTASTTYSVKVNTSNPSDTVYVNRSADDGDSSSRPRGVSTITLIEVAG